MVTSLNVDAALLQKAIELEQEIAIETLVEIALREYIQRRKQSKNPKLTPFPVEDYVLLASSFASFASSRFIKYKFFEWEGSSFGESLAAFREKYQMHGTNLV